MYSTRHTHSIFIFYASRHFSSFSSRPEVGYDWGKIHLKATNERWCWRRRRLISEGTNFQTSIELYTMPRSIDDLIQQFGSSHRRRTRFSFVSLSSSFLSPLTAIFSQFPPGGSGIKFFFFLLVIFPVWNLTVFYCPDFFWYFVTFFYNPGIF